MKILLSIALAFLTIPFSFGQGLEIYVVNHDYPDFTKKYSNDYCYYCFEPLKSDLNDSALILQSDIIGYDWEKQILILSDNGVKKINSLAIPLQGLAVAFTLDGEPVYGFWLWNIVSSFGCDRTYTFVYPDSNKLKLDFGLSKAFAKGSDPRFNEKIKEYLILTGLINNWP